MEGRVHAKTGTMTGVNALSGVLMMPNRPCVVFSFIVNQSERCKSFIHTFKIYFYLFIVCLFFRSSHEVRQDIDKFVVKLANF